VHAAVALGMMDPPPNYQPPKQTPSGKGPHANGFAHSTSVSSMMPNTPTSNSTMTTNLVIDQAEGEPVRRKKNLKM
jgi:hypothetical protein